jgi:methyl-accepting chemotaxis protein
MKFKKLSTKIAFFVCISTFIVAGFTAGLGQTRVIMRIGQYQQEFFRNEISTKVSDYNLPFTEAVYITRSLRNFAEANFDLAAYQADPEGYFANRIEPIMQQFVINTVVNADFINGAYFSVAPQFSGSRFIGEIFIESDGFGSYVITEPYPFEMYNDPSDPDMEWFFGAFNSGQGHWSLPFEDEGGFYVSYVEPVIINGVTVGVAGVDISVDQIKELIREYGVFDTGFALIRNAGDFFETNDFIDALSQSERDELSAVSRDVPYGDLFTITLNATRYTGIKARLINDYGLFLLVPTSEYNAEMHNAVRTFALLFPPTIGAIIVFGIFAGKSISKPIVAVSRNLETIGQGNYNTELSANVRQLPDEVGTLARTTHDLRLRLSYLTSHVKTISEHNLTETVDLAFQGDTAAIALNDTLNTLNNMFMDLNEMAEQLQSEATNLSDGSNVLSGGCSEQTAAVCDLTDAMERLVKNNNDSMEMLTEALEIEQIVKGDARTGDENMQKLATTVREINDASKGIHKILKAIEDIAFQTNILALNAAVEAARAGQHGKGFAVVAEEVRNLAAKSALAAKETAQLVGVSTRKAEEGEELTIITVESLSKIIEGIKKTEEIIERIEHNSHSNSQNITAINKDLGIVSGITHKTASTSEQTAAMAQELLGQADELRNIVSLFRIKGDRF